MDPASSDQPDPRGTSQPQGQHPQMPQSLCQANPPLAQQIRRHLQTQVVQTPGKPHTVTAMASTTIQLPELRTRPPDFQRFLKDSLFDLDMKNELKRAKALNWCRNIRPLYPLKTMGDGNCLLHAVAMAMWGIQDIGMLLRRLLYIAFVEDEEHCEIKKRWHKERGLLNEAISGFALSSREWEQEWEMVVKAAEDRRLDGQNNEPRYGDLLYECLEEIHIFVLSNVLKRPIVVLAEPVIRGITGTSLAPNNFRGIYLPLLWKPDDCIRTPVILAYSNNHFAPLVSIRESEDLAEDACPLVTYDLESLHIHFLLQHEEGVVHRILQSYLDVTEVTSARSDGVALVLAAKMDYKAMPENQDLMRHYMHYAERQYRELVKTRTSSSLTATANTQVKTPLSPNKEVHQGMEDLNLRINNFEESDPEDIREEESYHRSNMARKGGSEKPQPASQSRVPEPVPASPTLPCVTCKNVRGHSKYQGKCSMCYCKVEEPVEPKMKGASAEPSAPTHSIVSHPTPTPSMLEESWRQTSLTNTFVGPQPQPLIEGMSIVGTLCEHKGCSNMSSVHTFPYCYEHSPRHGGAPSRREAYIKQKSSSVSDENTGLEEAAPVDRRSLEEGSFHERGRGVPCKEPGCCLYGLPEWGHRCNPHRSARLAGNRESAAPRPSSPSWQKCRKSGCPSPGNAKYRGFCSSCFAREDPEDVQLGEGRPRRKISAKHGGKPPCPLPSSTSYERKLNEVSPCIGPTCNNTGFEVYQGLCEDCYTLLLQQKTPSTGPGVPQQKIRVSSQELRGERRREWASGVQMCRRENCNMFGSPETLGYCSQCWKLQQQLPGKNYVQIGSGNLRIVEPQMPQVPPQAQVLYKVTTGIAPPNTHPCKAAYCDRYGDVNLLGFCSECFNKRMRLNKTAKSLHQSSYRSSSTSMESPPSSPTHMQLGSHSAPMSPTATRETPGGEETYTQAMKRLEQSVRKSVRHCKTQNCTNFGNPKAQGYCNDCFKNQDVVPPPPRHHHFVGAFRLGGYDECDIGEST